ncbi:HPF/RaiA family ribosome-associated protein [Polluticoccus soli]|uniref:HPF/RaiA family ribosome-associated protein n=1 Tax=Polluticoccus soli TaxID=3034150 RepID=UPI0023E19677|nr:HPF/RaiA family ribosome-associated protein [Flavipsychrobacter sp. JY13-12]
MDIIIESPGFKASSKLENFIREKVSKLETHASNIVRADVTLYSGPASDPASFHCEIRLEVPGKDHFVKKSGDTYERAVVETVDTLERVMERSKARSNERRQPDRSVSPDAFTDENAPLDIDDVD